jgi:hypothetical protein
MFLNIRPAAQAIERQAECCEERAIMPTWARLQDHWVLGIRLLQARRWDQGLRSGQEIHSVREARGFHLAQ